MRKTIAALLALGAAGCGDPLVDGSYLGEPLVTLRGRVEGDAGTSTIRNPHLAILWFDYEGEDVRGVTSLARVRNMRFPSTFEIDVFDRPPASAYVELMGTRMAIGFLALIDDVDGDGRFSVQPEGMRPPDLIFGLAADQLIVDVAATPQDPRCGRWLFGADAPGGPSMFVARFGTCATAFVALPPQQPLVLRLFPPNYEGPGEEPSTCPDPVCTRHDDGSIVCEEMCWEGDGGETVCETPVCWDDPEEGITCWSSCADGTSCELPSCNQDPSHPFCEQEQAVGDCLASRCVGHVEQESRCWEQCDFDPTCFEQRCSAEQHALERCMYGCDPLGCLCSGAP